MSLSPGSSSCSYIHDCSMYVHHSPGMPQPPEDGLRVLHVHDTGCYGTSEGGKIWEVWEASLSHLRNIDQGEREKEKHPAGTK